MIWETGDRKGRPYEKINVKFVGRFASIPPLKSNTKPYIHRVVERIAFPLLLQKKLKTVIRGCSIIKNPRFTIIENLGFLSIFYSYLKM